ncbi:MAG: hypothetical protein QOG83_1793 [Alphaproteobacteria bacterium]|jgi:multisubunit Na+/H+ antiporter MnhB subunit|nr:hypothetical protein [Alphaproteobacteria bacterium]MEA2989082.1 hypothetical protein [Alphaproteobacteria bacterium]
MSFPRTEGREHYEPQRSFDREEVWSALVFGVVLAILLVVGIVLWNASKATRTVSSLADYATEHSTRPTLPSLPY